MSDQFVQTTLQKRTDSLPAWEMGEDLFYCSVDPTDTEQVHLVLI